MTPTGQLPLASADQALWTPSLGAWPTDRGVAFRVWAPHASRIELAFDRQADRAHRHPLSRQGDGTWTAEVRDIVAGQRYWYVLDDGNVLPDPASRFQPEGVHGPSEVVDPSQFDWSDVGWSGLPLERAVIYELHIGTFTPEGTFRSATERLTALAELGVTAVEIMPVADFAGQWNWGYDGVAPFAPSRAYGTPDDFRRLVDTAHRLGLAVILDVVYNHFGPDGAYQHLFSPYYFSQVQNPWGSAMNIDGPHHEHVRAYFIENALHWLHEYHLDGLRLDATHALVDRTERPFLAQFVEEVRARAGRPALLIAEDDRNEARMIRRRGEGGFGYDAVWADDFHHHMRRRLAGDHDGYYSDYTGSMADLADTIRHGWFYRGQMSAYHEKTHGTGTDGIPRARFIICLQNHDQVGNRAFGERLHHQIDAATWRAASAVLLLAPETPLLVMGQEWAAASPFLFFTDHRKELGELVSAGRRNEFAKFAAFSDPGTRSRIPDPQAPETFTASQLDWSEPLREPHASARRLYQAILAIRRELVAPPDEERFEVGPLGDEGLWLAREGGDGSIHLLIARLAGAGLLELRFDQAGLPASGWTVRLTTEEAAFATDAQAIEIHPTERALEARFARPGAVVLVRPATSQPAATS